MTADASVATTAPRIFPTVHYPDVDAGAAFLREAFGFVGTGSRAGAG